MSREAVAYLRAVANSSMADAKKKVDRLVWGKEEMLAHREEQYDEQAKEYIDTGFVACALGIAELAACSPKDAVMGQSTPEDMQAPRLEGWSATLFTDTCPLGKKPCKTLNFENVANAIMHINDQHSDNWGDCKKQLRAFAKVEETAVRKYEKSNPYVVTIKYNDEELSMRFPSAERAKGFIIEMRMDFAAV